jgi:uncharacterized caspase-like protein
LSITAFGESKTALIIANGNYDNFPSLNNPIPEAIQLKEALQRLNFDVTLIMDATREIIIDELYSFEEKVKGKGGLALFH